MHFLWLLVAALAVTTVCSLDDDLYRLPEGFVYGAGTGSYQTEGAWDAEGKGVSVFDHTLHQNSSRPNADVACDAYNHYEKDISLAKAMNFDVYRFSITWSRIFPNGSFSEKNQPGIDHYHKVIKTVRDHNMKALVTISHFDYPQALETAFGGWQDEKMIDEFVKYANFVFSEFGSEVSYWVTINEPNMHCMLMYSGLIPPGVTGVSNSTAVYRCIHHEVLAHARTYQLYREHYYEQQNGLVGVGAVTFFARPNSTQYEDVDAAYRANMFDVSILLHPLVYGDYPRVVRDTLEKKGRGHELLSFSETQKKELIGSFDFVGVNAYGDRVVASPLHVIKDRPKDVFDDIVGPLNDADVTILPTVTEVTPQIMRGFPLWIKSQYGLNVAIFITENGISTPGKGIEDWDTRAVYHSAYLRELMRTIHEEKVKVIGYAAWAFLDSYEFANGFESEEGLIHVDFNSPNRTRTLKKSQTFFQEVGETRVVPLVESSSADSSALGTKCSLLVVAACVLFSAIIS